MKQDAGLQDSTGPIGRTTFFNAHFLILGPTISSISVKKDRNPDQKSEIFPGSAKSKEKHIVRSIRRAK
jgi:hypothetical protein